MSLSWEAPGSRRLWQTHLPGTPSGWEPTLHHQSVRFLSDRLDGSKQRMYSLTAGPYFSGKFQQLGLFLLEQTQVCI